MGPQTKCVLLNKKQAVKDCNLTTPNLDDIAACSTKEDIEALADPSDAASVVTFLGSKIFSPAPILRDLILNAESRDP